MRYMYNRTFLETSVVRAGAISALTKLALAVPALKEDVCQLLTFRLDDSDDEVGAKTSFVSFLPAHLLIYGWPGP